jgi:hypothetical protein
MDDALSIGALCTAVTFIVETIKAWIPAKNKNDKGLTWKRGRKVYLIPNQAIWPLVSAGVGIGLFILVNYDPLGLGGYAGEAISGLTAGAAGGAGVFRIKNKLGSALGGDDATNAQATGPGREGDEI